MKRRRAKKNPPYSVEVHKPNKGGYETVYIVKRGFGPFASPVGYVTKIRNTRTGTHPYKAWHIGWDEKIVKESFRVFYEDSRYAKDGAYPGGKKAAFEYAAGGKGYETFDRQARERKSRGRRNPPKHSMLFGARSRATRRETLSHLIGLEVYEIRYRHATDGKDYRHEFETGVIMLGLPDGSIRIESATGKKLWEEINV